MPLGSPRFWARGQQRLATLGSHRSAARRSLRGWALGSSLALAAAVASATAFAATGPFGREIRSLTLHNTHNGEDLTVVFKRDGVYDKDGLAKLNRILRDVREDDATEMDPHLFDLVWEVYQETGATEPIQIVSGYRSPKTNAWLRKHSNGVAENSLHMKGKALDFYIPGVELAKLRAIGLRMQAGGVGFYPA